MPLAETLRSADDILSVSGKRWEVQAADDRAVMAIMQKCGVPEIVARLLAVRGIACEDAVQFLNPTLREQLPDPFHLKDMRKGAERVADAIMQGAAQGKIAIFGDYDVDGATSSALLMRYFRSLGIEPIVYIPDRIKEGYGPNSAALLGLKEQGASVVITVDCGTLAYAPLQAAKAAGLDVIVVDHHKGEPQLPEAFAVINPNRFDETSPHGQLAAVGVAFLFCVAVTKVLRERGFFSARSEPPLMQWLDIVALGTVCDVVPLVGVNRALVAQGLKVMAQRGNPGIAALMDVAKVDEKPGIYHAGFVIGPRINAGGRVGQSDLGVRILTGQDAVEMAQLARQLDLHNAERKAIEAMALEQAMQQAEQSDGADAMILVQAEGWHPGVIGIVAGRIKERFDKPVAVIAIKDGIGKASARSVAGIDIGNAVLSAVGAGLLEAGGGHAMAAGFTVVADKIPALRAFLNRALAAKPGEVRARTLKIDAALTIPACDADLARLIEQAGPYGAGHASPHFLLAHVRVLRVDIVGDGHVRAILGDGNARLTGSQGGLKAMAFRSAASAKGEALLNHKGRALHIADTIKLNSWNGRETADFLIEDVAWA